MARRPRVVIPGLPHHITQRGNNRQPIFFTAANRSLYLSLLYRQARECGVAVMGYCLMNNHVHLIAIPERQDSLSKALAHTHSEYALSINRTRERCGHLWQNRFFSCPMEPTHLRRALLYVDLNPVRAGLVHRPEQWQWSSALIHTQQGLADPLMAEGWEEYLGFWDHSEWRRCLRAAIPDEDLDLLRAATHRGEPLGDEGFVQRLEEETGRTLRVHRRGRPEKCV